MQPSISSRVNANPTPILILDGGLGTTLKDQYQAEVDGVERPLWSSHLLISDPIKLLAIQTAFVDAGADIILTATYQASFEGFASTAHPHNGWFGIPREEAERYMRSAVGISRASIKSNPGSRSAGKVALSLGAYGAIMVPSQEYTGQYDDGHKSVERLRKWHKERLDVFSNSRELWTDIDMVAFETIPLLAEIKAVREAMWMGRENDALERMKPFWVSCVFPGQCLCLPDGSSVEDVVTAMLRRDESAAVPFAIGINCTKISKIAELLTQFETVIKKLVEDGDIDRSPSLVLYPDGTKGEVYNTTTHEWEMPENVHDTLPWEEIMFDIVRKTGERAVWSGIVAGGCCKTMPDDIRKLRLKIDAIKT